MDWDRQTDEYTLDIKSQGVGGRKMKLNFGPLFSAISKNFLFLDFFSKLSKVIITNRLEIIKKYKNISFSSRFNGEINKRMEKTENKNPGGGRQQLLQIRF